VLFTHMAGIDVLHVPYKGAGPSLNAVMSGESQATFVPAPSVMGHVRAGRLWRTWAHFPSALACSRDCDAGPPAATRGHRSRRWFQAAARRRDLHSADAPARCRETDCRRPRTETSRHQQVRVRAAGSP
jgi:hypothetical protein